MRYRKWTCCACEREVARYRGDRDQASAQITRIQAAISEASRKIEEVELKMRNDAGAELSETMAKLAALSEGNVALSDRVKRASLRSPLKGTVKRLLVNTVGGVVMPGKDVVEIVPLEDTLLLEARVAPRDIAFLRPGQKAIVKFTAYDFSIYGGMDAKLEQIGADTVVDEKGNAFYVVRVRTEKSALGKRESAHHPRHGGGGRYSYRQEERSVILAKTGPARQVLRAQRTLTRSRNATARDQAAPETDSGPAPSA